MSFIRVIPKEMAENNYGYLINMKCCVNAKIITIIVISLVFDLIFITANANCPNILDLYGTPFSLITKYFQLVFS